MCQYASFQIQGQCGGEQIKTDFTDTLEDCEQVNCYVILLGTISLLIFSLCSFVMNMTVVSITLIMNQVTFVFCPGNEVKLSRGVGKPTLIFQSLYAFTEYPNIRTKIFFSSSYFRSCIFDPDCSDCITGHKDCNSFLCGYNNACGSDSNIIFSTLSTSEQDCKEVIFNSL